MIGLKNCHWILERPIAHRGLHREGIPENSIAAFEAAIGEKYPIEMDVRFSREGIPIVFHDRKSRRLTGVKGAIRDMAAGHISMLRLKDTNHHIPTLEEVLAFVDGRVPVIIEIKSNVFNNYKALKEMHRMIKDYQYDMAVMSFDVRIVAWLMRHDPQICIGQLLHGYIFIQRWVHIFLWYVWGKKGDFIGVTVRSLTCKIYQFFRNSQVRPLLTWTVRTKEERKLAKVYSDNIIFEN